MNIKEKRITEIANAYYNRGLAKANIRDLTGAAEDLKKALRYDKYQKDARNLLGLICFETGEVGAALEQWVISLNLTPEGNLAEEYLDQIRSQQGFLDLADQSIKRYNQALSYAQTNNEDLAVLLLVRMLEDFPQYVKAQELLALLYIHSEDFTRAGQCLYEAEKIDRYNPRVQYYMDIAKQNTGRAEVEKRKLKNAFSHRRMQDDDIILPPSYRENTGWQSVLNILAGLLIGLLVSVFLILPANRNSLNRQHNEELLNSLALINEKSLQIDELEEEIQTAVLERDEAGQQLAGLTGDSEYLRLQYRNLVQVLTCLENEAVTDASLIYSDTDWSVLQQEEGLAPVLADIYQVMYETGYKLLENRADDALDTEDYPEAVDLYTKSLAIRGDNTSALYKLGLAFAGEGDTESANLCFGDIIMNNPDSEYAQMAKEQRGY